MRCWRVALVLTVVCSATAHSQEMSSGVSDLLTKLYAYSRDYRAKLPSMECDESLVSQIVVKGEVRKEAKLQGVLRNARRPDDHERFDESYVFKKLNGEPIPAGQSVKIPYFVRGGFVNGVGFSNPEKQDCYDYALTPLEPRRVRLTLTLRKGSKPAVCDDIGEGYRKTVVADPDTGQVFRVDLEMSAKAAERMKQPAFGSVVFELQRLGDQELLLPTKMEAHDGKNERRITATYSNFHRYAATVTLESTDVETDPDY